MIYKGDMKAGKLTKDEVIRYLKKRQDGRNQLEFCKEIGISPSYLSEIYKGTREPAAKILDWLGLEKVVEYRGKS